MRIGDIVLETFLGLLLIAGVAVLVVGLVLLLIAIIRKGSKKTPGIITAIGAVAIIIPVVAVMVFPPADYTVTTTSEGQAFVKQLNDGADVKGQTLKFKVKAIGAKNGAIAWQMPGGVDVIVPASKAAQAVKKGDTVTVDCQKTGGFLNLWIITGKMD